MADLTLKDLNPDWQIISNRLTRSFSFPDFSSALSFVNRVGQLAEKLKHHPDIKLSYGSVKIFLFTHDANGLTAKDFDLAKSIDSL